jgi:signal transduction histidine kinase
MANVFVRFGERVIALFRNYIFRTQLTLAVFYFCVSAAMLGLSGEITRVVFLERVTPQFEDGVGIVPAKHPRASAKTVRKELRETMLVVNGILLTFAGISGYFLAGLTLKPLERSYRKEQQFLNNVSHELRTPLTILRTSLENMQQKEGNELQCAIEESIEEIDRMEHVMRNLLLLSRAEQRALPMDRVAVSDLVVRVIDRMQIFATRKGQTIVYEGDDKKEMLWGNEYALEQAITNVIENAILYNSLHGTVRVRVQTRKRRVKILIEDTGIGMSQEDVARSTERLYRAEKSRNRAQGGSGIGLSLVDEIVKLHRGTLNIASEVGKGTTVTLSFPVHTTS